MTSREKYNISFLWNECVTNDPKIRDLMKIILA